jgi:hypothetical protein
MNRVRELKRALFIAQLFLCFRFNKFLFTVPTSLVGGDVNTYWRTEPGSRGRGPTKYHHDKVVRVLGPRNITTITWFVFGVRELAHLRPGCVFSNF